MVVSQSPVGGNQLSKGSVSFIGLLGLTLAGVLAIIGPIEIAAFIGDTGPAAIWPMMARTPANVNPNKPMKLTEPLRS